MTEDRPFQLPFQIISVGQPFGDIMGVGGTRATFDFYSALGQLVMYVDKPTDQEIKAVESGEIKLGMTQIVDEFGKEKILFLVWKFGDELIFETSYTINLRLKDFEFIIPEEGMGYGIQIVLVDSSTGIVKALRVIGTSKEWSDDFRNICIEQLKMEEEKKKAKKNKDEKKTFDKQAYSNSIDHIYRLYSTEEIFSMAKIYKIKWKAR